jgi:hypothetical protein
MGKEYVLEKLRELTGRQHDRADETRANAAQEDTLKGGKTARYRVQAVHDPRLRAVVGLPKVVQASHQSAAHHSLNPKGTMQVRRAIALFWRAPPCTARWVAGAYEELGSKNR